MQVRRYEDPDVFYARVEAFLMRREADHNLLLGILSEIRQNPQIYPGLHYFAAVERGDEVLLAALRTPPHPLALSHALEPGAAALLAEDLEGSPFAPDRASGPAATSLAFAEAWSERTGRPFRRSLALRIYKLTRVRAPAGVPGRLRPAGAGDRDLLARWFYGFQTDALGESDTQAAQHATDRWLGTPTRGLYLWEDGEPVSMAGYSGPTPNGMRIAAVYTPPERRRRGYASACVAALCQLLLDSGRTFCFLFTDLANPTSNHIYQEIGFEPVCDVDEYTL
ncbi:MAG TPA: GNAT family N-acetyltransferase [Roseiflexaceae bacterium]|nr:GNAT family N-acetyltransferase [Roseiflexaceae bacterium]